MPNLHDIERRINSVTSTKQITRTMEMVAAAKIRRAIERVEEATPYSDSMMEMLANVAERATESENALLQKHEEVKNVLVVAVVSDRGLAGGFNSNVLRHVEHLIKEKEAQGAHTSVVACGKKAISYFNYRKITPVLEFRDLSADPTVEEASAITTYAVSAYQDGLLDEVYIVYNHAKNAAEQTLRQELVLPIDPEALLAQSAASVEAREAQEGEGEGSEGGGEGGLASDDIVFEPNAQAVLNSLLPAYIRSTVFHALIDSAAAEQGARRTAMMSATENANEMVEMLTRQYNRVRQGAITTEITEIVSGASALED